LSRRRIQAESVRDARAGRQNGDAPASTDRGRYLSDACDLLWPYPATIAFDGAASGWTRAPAAVHTPDAAQASCSEFILLLGTRRPRLLVPTMRAAGAVAVRSYGEPKSRAGRLGVRLLSFALASGIGGAVFRSRVRVSAPPGTDTIEAFLRNVLGRDILLSLYLGVARANRKPVLQLLTPQGQPLGFAKIGVNSLTTALVHAEHEALIRLGQAGLREVMVPRVLHYGEWRGMNVLVISTLPVWHRRRPVTKARLAAAMNSVARLGGTHREPLAASRYWQRLTDRLAAAEPSADRDALLSALSALGARAGDTPLVLGCWHGDWTPWNMVSTRVGLLVWDWERFTDDVPLGFDALHYSLQRDVLAARRNPRDAAGDCVEDAPNLLAPFGIEARDARLTAVLYLADLATRYLADRQAQAGARRGAAGTWLIPAITDQLERL